MKVKRQKEEQKQKLNLSFASKTCLHHKIVCFFVGGAYHSYSRLIFHIYLLILNNFK